MGTNTTVFSCKTSFNISINRTEVVHVSTERLHMLTKMSSFFALKSELRVAQKSSSSQPSDISGSIFNWVVSSRALTEGGSRSPHFPRALASLSFIYMDYPLGSKLVYQLSLLSSFFPLHKSSPGFCFWVLFFNYLHYVHLLLCNKPQQPSCLRGEGVASQHSRRAP